METRIDNRAAKQKGCFFFLKKKNKNARVMKITREIIMTNSTVQRKKSTDGRVLV